MSGTQVAQMARDLDNRLQRRVVKAGLNAEFETVRPLDAAVIPPVSYSFPITTVSLSYNFDAYINVGFAGAEISAAPSLLVDSGNSSLIVPRWEDILAIPNYEGSYQVLGQTTEPWGCPANVVKGPIQLFDVGGNVFTIQDCIFYACTGGSQSDGSRTANFGTGCIYPWSASWSNVPTGIGVTLQPVLSQTKYPFVEFDYAPMGQMQLANTTATASVGSSINIYDTLPAGYQMFDILPNSQWMALTPTSLSIAGAKTQWPGTVASPIAMIDTGGGPVYLSDPNGYIYQQMRPSPVSNPDWASSSTLCQSTQAPIGIVLSDGTGSFAYVIDNSLFPAPAQGLTLVMCESNAFMMGQQGMNIGGISALINSILIDFKNNRVGFRKR